MEFVPKPIEILFLKRGAQLFMESRTNTTHIIFAVNPTSGTASHTLDEVISSYFKGKEKCSFSIFHPRNQEEFPLLKEKIQEEQPQIVVAAGGDGTVNWVARHLYGTSIKLGIIPIGSANGLARDLNLPYDVPEALRTFTEGKTISLSSLTINDQFCIHLSDIGLNAKLIRAFEHRGERGLAGYFKAGFRVLKNYATNRVSITANGKTAQSDAVMVVIANATMYGTGFVINPIGKLDDHVFEIIVIKKYSLIELCKMAFNNWMPHPDKTDIIQCSEACIESESPLHFQIDGEYIGKKKSLTAAINNRMIQVIVP